MENLNYDEVHPELVRPTAVGQHVFIYVTDCVQTPYQTAGEITPVSSSVPSMFSLAEQSHQSRSPGPRRDKHYRSHAEIPILLGWSRPRMGNESKPNAAALW